MSLALTLIPVFAVLAITAFLCAKKLKALGKRGIFLLGLGISLLPGLYVSLVSLGLLAEAYVRIHKPMLAALSLAAMAAISLLAIRGKSNTQRARQVAIDVSLVVLTLSLSFTVMGMEVGQPIDRLTVIVAVDRSRSIDLVPGATDRVLSELLKVEESMRDEDELGVVAFGVAATTEQAPRTKSEPKSAQEAAVARDGSDLDAAIRRALSEVPADSGARIVVMSDGVATRGDVMAGAAAALAAQIPVDVIPLMQEENKELRVVSVRAPTQGNTGEAVDLAVVTRASEETVAEIRIKRDGQLIRRGEVTIAKGEDVLRVREKLGDAGLHRYDVEVSAKGASLDSTPEDNAGATFVRVRGRASALIIEGDGRDAAAFLENALSKADIDVDVVGPGAVPADLGAFAAYDLIVLSDIPAASMSPTQLNALATYVREFGGGLLLLGGDRGLGPGGYGKTPIEEVSPVSFDLKQDQRRASLAQVIAIDISGSMAAEVNGKTKLELANEAASRSAELLGLNDRLGVEHVDTKVYWTVPLAPVVDASKLGDAIRSMPVGGGGILVPITLTEGYAALRSEKTNIKHLLLFADGSDAEDMEPAKPLTAAALVDGITTSVVALGQGKDVPDLEEMSRLGKGRFYLIEDASRLPAVFAQETILAARSALYEEPFQPTMRAPGAVAAGLTFDEAPELLGYVVTLPKPRATIHLAGPEDDPILATWSVGVGRSGIFTSDFKSRWGLAWTEWPTAAKLVVQLSRDLLRRAEDQKVRTEATVSNGQLHVRATVVSNDGRAANFRRVQMKVIGPDGFEKVAALEASGAGSYTADLPVERPGNYVILASDALSGELLGTTGAVMSRGEELRVTGSDVAVLERLAEFTGGTKRESLEGIFNDRPKLRFAYRDIQSQLLVIAAVALLLMVASRKLGMPEALADFLRGKPAAQSAPSGDITPEQPSMLETLRTAKQKATRGAPPAVRVPPAPASAPATSIESQPDGGLPAAPARPRPTRLVGLHPIAQRDTGTPAAQSPTQPAASSAPVPNSPSETGGKVLSAAERLAAKKRANKRT